MSMAREQWASRYGFVLATIGGAVGIGNIWRFSYVAGENGGGAFLLVYLGCVVLIGVPLVIAELVIGRHTQGDAITAFRMDRRPGAWTAVGCLAVIAAVLLLSYYAVIAGWALKYFVGAAAGPLWQAAGADYGGYFRAFIAERGEPIGWQAAALALAMFVVAGGVRRGIERVNKVLMPLLATVILVLAGYALSLPGAGAGVAFLFAPDWSALRVPGVYVAALGQAFFSLGVGMAFFVTYGSYVPRTVSLPGSAGVIAIGDTLFAVVAGLAIFPAVFALGGNPAAGPELAFITLPQILIGIPAGHVVGTVFFLLLSVAAATSMVALLEIPVAALTTYTRLTRWRATAIMGATAFLAGLPSALSYGLLAEVQIGSRGILDAVDHGVSNYLLPVIGIGTALYVGWRLERALVIAEAGFARAWLARMWLWLVRLFVPVAIAGIIVHSTGAL